MLQRNVVSSRLLAVTCGFLIFAAAGQACSSSSDGRSPTEDAGVGDEAAPMDAGRTFDASGRPLDGGSSNDAATGAPCTFNRDCSAADRCECDEATGCFCQAGARGTGVNGIDPCTTGDDCASSLCVEGPDGGSFCSDECGDAGGCTGALPVCEDVAGIGMICVRQP